MKTFALSALIAVAAVLGVSTIASAQYGPTTTTTEPTTTTTEPGTTTTTTEPGTTTTGPTTTTIGPGTTTTGPTTSTTEPEGDAGGPTPPAASTTTTIVVASSGALPSTGSDGLGTTTGIAIGLIAVGLGLSVVTRVRRSQLRRT